MLTNSTVHRRGTVVEWRPRAATLARTVAEPGRLSRYSLEGETLGERNRRSCCRYRQNIQSLGGLLGRCRGAGHGHPGCLDHERRAAVHPDCAEVLAG